jgi:hypothetical protein
MLCGRCGGGDVLALGSRVSCGRGGVLLVGVSAGGGGGVTKLTDLDAHFVAWTERGWRRVDTLDEATGVTFLCPKCFAANGGNVGTHIVICWSESRGTPASAVPGPGRWKLDGTGLHDLTLNADPPRTARSVALSGGCAWHGFVNNGDAA